MASHPTALCLIYAHSHEPFSFQESERGVFDPVRRLITIGKGRIRRTGPDYLAYALLDAVVDN